MTTDKLADEVAKLNETARLLDQKLTGIAAAFAPRSLHGSNLDAFVLRGGRWAAEVDAAFEERRTAFRAWVEQATAPKVVAFRVTAVPLGRMAVARLNSQLVPRVEIKTIKVGQESTALSMQIPHSESATVGGFQRTTGESQISLGTIQEQMRDGTAEIRFAQAAEGLRGADVAIHWILGAVGNVLEMVRAYRALANLPEALWEMEVEIRSKGVDLVVHLFNSHRAGQTISRGSTLFPRVTIGADSAQLVKLVLDDVLGAAGREPFTAEVQLVE